MKNPRDTDSPIITKEGIRRAVPFIERFPHMKLSSITIRINPPASSTTLSAAELDLPLSSDVLQDLLATGPEWRTLADDLLRDGLKRRKQAYLRHRAKSATLKAAS